MVYLAPLLRASLFLAAFASAQKTSTTLNRQSLGRYDLATCNDGSKAVYYHEQSTDRADDKVLIYLPNDPISCSDASSCRRKCERSPEGCSAPIESSVKMSEGVWSQEASNNPFADYFKVLLPSCSSDEFSGTRGASSATGGLAFHGRHIFSSLLRDLTSKYGMDRAKEVVLVGTGSGARGAGRNCDFLASAIASVNPDAKVRCVLDGIDLVPYWVRGEGCDEMSLRAEEQKFLWGRKDDESCVSDGQDRLNSTELALSCGVFSKYFRHVETPFFVTTNQLDNAAFSEATCGITSDAEDFSDYTVGWRQGVLSLAEAMSVDKPDAGWFIPNCDAMPGFLDEDHAHLRRTVTVPELDAEEGDKKQNILQTINGWLTTGRNHQAIDAFGVPNALCSAKRSLPLDLRPDTLLPEVGETEQKLRASPAAVLDGRRTLPVDAAFTDFAFGPRSRFVPPRDLFSDSAIVANAAPDGAIPINDFLDYDGFSLGTDFDYGIETGVAPVVGAAVGGIPRVSAVSGPVSGPAIVATGPRVRPHLYHRQPAVVHSHGRRRSLWRRLYYLEYLRNLYAKNYRAYHDEYYGTGVPVAATVPVRHAVQTNVYRRTNGYTRGYRTRHGHGGYRRGGAYFARIQKKEEDDNEEAVREKVTESEALSSDFQVPDSQVETFQKLQKRN